MSTSTIGIIDKKGKIEGIYCHNEGHIGYTGVILDTFYNTEEKVKELISLGSISLLGFEIPKVEINFEDYENNLCTKYRNYYTIVLDKKEKIKKKSIEDFVLEGIILEDFSYIYFPAEKKWKVIGGVFTKMVDLKKAISLEMEVNELEKDSYIGDNIDDKAEEELKEFDEIVKQIPIWKKAIEDNFAEIKNNPENHYTDKFSYKEFLDFSKYFYDEDEDEMYTIQKVDFQNETVELKNKTKDIKKKPIINLIYDVFSLRYGLTNPSKLRQWKRFEK